MYKVYIMEAFGPFCGRGGYATCIGMAMSKSPHVAYRLAQSKVNQQDQGGGVPILRTATMTTPYGKVYKMD